MPLYEYQCDACGARFELIRKFSDPPLETCPTCKSGPVQKLVSSPAFQFKGSGWYITDYARKAGGDSKGEAKSGTEASDKADKSSASSETPASKDSSTGGKEAKPAAATPSTTKDS